MKNYEKYAEKIKNYDGKNFCNNFVIPVIRKGCECLGSCVQCRMLQMIWLMEECEKPEVDWSTVAVDTPILVRDYEDEKWVKKHFAKFENGKVYTWFNGGTSWSSSSTMDWRYAELAETENAE